MLRTSAPLIGTLGLTMTVSPVLLLEHVDKELSAIGDRRVAEHVRSLLVTPKIVVRGWDYGRESEEYPCWFVLEHPQSNTGIAYCEYGFGPSDPWGLVFLSGTEHMTIGMDAGWYPNFLGAYFESSAAADLPIWRVFCESIGGHYPGTPLTPEGDWHSTWSEVMRLRKLNPGIRYHCEQSVYRSEA